MANAEAVVVKDSCLVNLLRHRINEGSPDDYLIGMKHNDISAAINMYVDVFGVPHPPCHST